MIYARECFAYQQTIGLRRYSIYIHVYTVEYYSAIKKNEILPFAATWVDHEGIMLSEISQAEKDKYCIVSLICGI